MRGSMRPETELRADFLLLVERLWTACRGQARAPVRPMPNRWTSASQRSSPRCRTRSTSPRASRWATPCARARSACGSARRSGSTTTSAPSLFYALLLKDAGCSSNAAKLSALFGADDFELKRARKLTEPPAPVRGAASTRVRYARTRRLRGDRPQRRRGRPRHDRAALRARRRDRAHDRADRVDRRGDPRRSTSTGTATATPTASPATRSRCSAASSASPRPSRCSSPPPARAPCSTSPPTAAAPGSTPTLVDALRADAPRPRVLELARRPRAARGDRRLRARGPRPARRRRAARPRRRGVRADHRRQVALHRHATRSASRASRSPSATCSASARASCATSAAPALLHDIGKLGVSNLILDKPGKLDRRGVGADAPPPGADRAHPRARQRASSDLAATAGAHHERLDGRGYHLGLRDEQLNRDARILAVADVCEALTADRPYRERDGARTGCARSCAATSAPRSATRRSARSRRRASSAGGPSLRRC